MVVHADCFDWLSGLPENTLHAVVTDPPYGVKEYDADQLEKRANGKGGIWRIPPSFDGHVRAPLPRFTALNGKERPGSVSSSWTGAGLSAGRFARAVMSLSQPTPLFANSCTMPWLTAAWSFAER